MAAEYSSTVAMYDCMLLRTLKARDGTLQRLQAVHRRDQLLHLALGHVFVQDHVGRIPTQTGFVRGGYQAREGALQVWHACGSVLSLLLLSLLLFLSLLLPGTTLHQAHR